MRTTQTASLPRDCGCLHLRGRPQGHWRGGRPHCCHCRCRCRRRRPRAVSWLTLPLRFCRSCYRLCLCHPLCRGHLHRRCHPDWLRRPSPAPPLHLPRLPLLRPARGGRLGCPSWCVLPRPLRPPLLPGPLPPLHCPASAAGATWPALLAPLLAPLRCLRCRRCCHLRLRGRHQSHWRCGRRHCCHCRCRCRRRRPRAVRWLTLPLRFCRCCDLLCLCPLRCRCRRRRRCHPLSAREQLAQTGWSGCCCPCRCCRRCLCRSCHSTPASRLRPPSPAPPLHLPHLPLPPGPLPRLHCPASSAGARWRAPQDPLLAPLRCLRCRPLSAREQLARTGWSGCGCRCCYSLAPIRCLRCRRCRRLRLRGRPQRHWRCGRRHRYHCHCHCRRRRPRAAG